MAREISTEEQQLIDIIKPLRSEKWSADFRWDRIENSLTKLGEDWGGFELVPDFQRGHVWTAEQQVHFIENCLRGVVGLGGMLIQFNCPNWSQDLASTDLPAGFQCVDGLQRFTAISEFIKGNIKPFGLSKEQLMGTRFSPIHLHMKVAIHDFTSREELLSHYLSINRGGTPHSAEEIERVSGLLEAVKSKAKA